METIAVEISSPTVTVERLIISSTLASREYPIANIKGIPDVINHDHTKGN
ncbi:MAG: hypothetical protein ACQCN4_06860 [Candidatus Bathyarchaeia archaeon]